MGRARHLLIGIVVLAVLALLGGTAVAARGAMRPATAPTPNLRTDPSNCGAVGFRVPPGDVCRNGIATAP